MRIRTKTSLVLFLLGCLLLGCAEPPQPLPTLQPLAVVPDSFSEDVIALQSLPATFTPLPPATTTPTITPTPPPTATPTSTLTPTPLPTLEPNIIPDYLMQSPVNATYIEQPPLAVDCSDRGLLFRSRFPSTIGGPWRYYHAYLPSCYGQDGRAYPTLYLFHGSIQTDSHWADLGLVGYLDRGIASGRYPPFIVIMPYNDTLGNISSGGENSIEGVTVNALIPFIDASYCTWADRLGRSVGGISRGGYWALSIAFRHTDLFTAVAGHSSHLRFETDPARYNPLATYATADLSNMRIWMDWGERDFLRHGQQQLDAALTAAGIPHDVHINGGGHSDAYWMVHLSEYIDWHTAVWPRDRALYPACQR